MGSGGRMIPQLFTAMLLLVATTNAVDIVGHVSIPNGPSKVAPIKILLNGGEQVTYVRSDGSFALRNVVPGRYALDIPDTAYLFPQYKLDVAEDETIRALHYKYPGAGKQSSDYPLRIEPVGTINYFEKREKMSILSLIMNPSFLTIIVPIGLMYILPKLSEGLMDPEEMKKAQEEMGGAQDPSAMLSNMFGGGGGQNDDSDDD